MRLSKAELVSWNATSSYVPDLYFGAIPLVQKSYSRVIVFAINRWFLVNIVATLRDLYTI